MNLSQLITIVFVFMLCLLAEGLFFSYEVSNLSSSLHRIDHRLQSLNGQLEQTHEQLDDLNHTLRDVNIIIEGDSE